MKQATVSREGSFSGAGLHTGKPATVRLKPAPENTGIRFSKRGKPVTGAATESSRCSAVGEGPDQILTVEHLLAAAVGLGVTNLQVDVDGDEMPALDGSAKDFAGHLRSLGIQEQTAVRPVYKIREPILCHKGTAAVAVYPDERFRVTYTLDYPQASLARQTVHFTLGDAASFERDLAPARTFCSKAEADAVLAKGLGRGANAGNTLVMGENGPVEGALRFPDECARHKALDLVGDLGLLDFSIVGHVVGIRSGHALNRELGALIRKQKGDHGN